MQPSNNNHQLVFLSTFFNREENTFHSITQLIAIMNSTSYKLNYKIILVDDKSTDNTAELCAKLPNVHVIQTKGDQYWARSMIFGFEFIRKNFPDFRRLIVFNDDISPTKKAMAHFIKEAMLTSDIFVAPFHDGLGNKTYGGVIRASKFNLLSFQQAPIDHALCDTMNANMASIPTEVIAKIGFFKSYFVHGGADYEYGIRAKNAGLKIRQFNEFIGVCERNAEKDHILSQNEFIFPTIISRKYFPPLARLKYYWSHAGILGIFFYWTPYLRALKHDISIFFTLK